MKPNIGRDHLIQEIRCRVESAKQPFVVAISGYGGSGKSSLAREISESIPGSVILAIDDYYAPIPLPDDDWAAFDRVQLRSSLDQQTSELVICEGVGLLHPDTLDRYDLKVWVDVDLETATARGMKRDREEYNVDHDRLWREEWVPTELRFEAKHNPKAKADYWVDNFS